jgi:hypothetical protein
MPRLAPLGPGAQGSHPHEVPPTLSLWMEAEHGIKGVTERMVKDA